MKIIKEKTKKTNLAKYGVDNVFKDTEKIKNSFYTKYGADNPSKVSEVVEKRLKTFESKYGENPYSKFFNMQKDTIYERYGVYNPFNHRVFKEKANNTRNNTESNRIYNKALEYGFEMLNEYKTCYDENLWKCTNCQAIFKYRWIRLYVNRSCPKCSPTNPRYSKPQLKLFKLCQETLPYPIIEYPCNGKFIDIAIPQLPLAIEYDSSYWHRNHYEDMRRQKLLENEGWNFLRYRDYIPTKEELISDVNSIFKLDN